jgi:hypothetical protein
MRRSAGGKEMTTDYATIRVPKDFHRDQKRGYMITLIDEDGNPHTIDAQDLEKCARVTANCGWAPDMGRDHMHLEIVKRSAEELVNWLYEDLLRGRLERLDRLVEKKTLDEQQKKETIERFGKQREHDKADIRKKVAELFPVAKVAEFPEGSPFRLVRQFGS